MARDVNVAVDTDILVRLLVADDVGQAERARSLFETSGIFVPITVALECWWILEAVYRVPARKAAEAFRHLLGLPHVIFEHEERILFALDAALAGLDFADALHLAATPEGKGFATFDRRLARRAGRIPGAPRVFEPGGG